jgi:hypothetical protein
MNRTRFNTCAIAVALVITLPLFAQVAEGDKHYAARAEGATHIDAASAYRFKGAYHAKSSDAKKQIYGVAKTAGEKALAAVSRALAAKGVKADAPEKTIAATAKQIPHAADVYLWDAINWGEWALAYGKLAAARQGAADRIRRGATIAHLANPALEGGSPARVLGRLHDQTPRIPFITGWASSKEAVRFLNESLKYDAKNKITLVFLAEAMVANDAGAKSRAVELLRGVINAPNDPQFAVEDAAAVEDAKKLLKQWAG